DLKRFADSPPAWIRAARSDAAGGKLSVEFDVDAEANFVDVSEGRRISFELREPVTDAKAVAAQAAQAAQAPQTPAAVAVVTPDGLPVLTTEIVYFPMPARKGAPTLLTPAPGSAKTDAAAVAAAATPEAEQPMLRDSVSSKDPLPPGFRPASSEIVDAMTPAAVVSPATPGKAKAEIYGATLRLELPYTKLP